MNRFWSVLAPFPVVAMSEDETAYRVSAELPGYHCDDLEISVSGHELILQDVRRHFRRAVHMPPFIHREQIHADLTDGTLTVTLPKADHESRRCLPIFCC